MIKHAPFSLLLLALLFSAPAGFAQDDAVMEAPPPVENDIGIGDTSVGDKGDVGTADSLDGTEGAATDVPPPPEVAAPEAAPSGTADGGTPAAAETTAEAPPKPAPVKRKKRRAPRVVERHADGPDFRREKNFNRIYMEFNEQPTPTEAWDQAASGSASKVYKVQNGDTLWDLSKTLFGDPNYWPKIWSLNSDQIYNPHEIDTWMNVRFFPGDLNEPPSLSIEQTESVEVAAAAPVSEGESVSPAEPSFVIPPPARKPRPVIKNIPGSLPLYRYEVVNQPPPDFEQVKPPPAFARPNATLSYYVTENEVNSLGQVKETELGGPTASEYQYVFVQAPSAGRFLVVKDLGPLGGEKGGHGSARVIEVQGEIEVIEAASDRENLQRAIVRRSLAPIELGSKLIRGSIESISTQDGAPAAGPALKIVGSQYGNDRRMVDAEGLVFLNGGSRTGLQVGQILPIYADRSVRNPETSVRLGGKLIGHVRVVKLTPNFATGFLTSVTDDILIGDDVGRRSSGAALSAAPTGPVLEDEGAAPPALDGDDELTAELNSGDAAVEAAPMDEGDVAAPVQEDSSSDEGELTLDEADF
ncbi:MAG: LysM peptidoglycan-binding domain-containing protein [Bdellovibrionaceae bacterium]|nr:LysM peptidoglycan-binding domain-containing protein [Pseudobdellovibrionaceae bacterium]